jgi:hypothetical protein
MEQIEYILHPDGRIEEKVTGVVGSICAELTRSIEQSLGHTSHQDLTNEYYQQAWLNPTLQNIVDTF